MNPAMMALVFVALLGMSGVVSAGFCETSTINYCTTEGCTVYEVIILYYSCSHPFLLEEEEIFAR